MQGVEAVTKIGTPLYVAPEAFDVDYVYDFRFDVWSLGVILYELMTLEVPFKSRQNILQIFYDTDLVKDPVILNLIRHIL